MRFDDDEPVECDVCGDLIYAGETYQEARSDKNTYVCCDCDECMGKLLIQLYGNVFQEKMLNTAYEKYMIYADMNEGD